MIGYVRVSTEEQALSGLGLEGQRRAIAEAAAQRGWELTGIVEDAGLSGSTLAGRAGLESVLQIVSTHQADGLVVAKLDRLSRSLLDFSQLMERSRREGWAIVALDLGVDTSTPQGELMAAVLATFAQFERRLIGQRTKSALDVKRAQGVILGRRRTIPDDVYARMLAMRAQEPKVSFQKIADAFNDEAIPTGQGGRWYPATIQQAIKSRNTNKENDHVTSS